MQLTETERITLDNRYGRGEYEVTHRFKHDESITLVAHFFRDGHRGYGYDVWKGNLDGIQNLGNGGATVDGALWYASNWAPEAKPAL